MLEATVLALVAAALHAGWNLAVKVRGDRLAFLCAQFVLGGLMGITLLAVLGDLGAVAWGWAFTSAAIHVPYLLLLALVYREGDFSLVYPLARGGGALLAAVGGVVLLDDHLTRQSWLAIAVVAGGLASLAAPSARSAAVTSALLLAAVIAAYTLADARGARSSSSPAYGLATFAAGALGASLVLLITRRGAVAVRLVRTEPRICLGVAAASVAAYALVLAAVRLAPVGYVTCLRESSVVLAALAGWKLLHEPLGPRRVLSSVVVLVGLVLLIASG
jgi:multidrug transporter EmrE-like cation transporter